MVMGMAYVLREDNCPFLPNQDQVDVDQNGVGDLCQPDDGDGIAVADDNCSLVANPSQADQDMDGLGDVCDPDIDGDGIDNEPLSSCRWREYR